MQEKARAASVGPFRVCCCIALLTSTNRRRRQQQQRRRSQLAINRAHSSTTLFNLFAMAPRNRLLDVESARKLGMRRKLARSLIRSMLRPADSSLLFRNEEMRVRSWVGLGLRMRR